MEEECQLCCRDDGLSVELCCQCYEWLLKERDDLRAEVKRLKGIAHETCECRGFGFFWGSEIKGWRGNPLDRVLCLRCRRPGLITRLRYRMKGYSDNSRTQ